MLTFPGCKINIGLFVTRKRDDGYHDLETVFYPVKEIKDALEVVEKPSFDFAQDDNASTQDNTSISLSGLAVMGNEKDNLVWKAYRMMKETFGSKIPVLDIFLHKAIPMGAGLGGGSADGAFMLRLLNDFCGLNLSKETLATMALELGSDCPFFICNTPQFATGRGEKMQPIHLDLSRYEIRIETPGIHVSTRDAFAMIKPKPAAFDLRNLSADDIDNWKDYVINDFEEPVFTKHPALKKIKEKFYKDGAVYSSMSGSGSAVYGIFKK